LEDVVAACYVAAARVWARAAPLGRRREEGNAWGIRRRERGENKGLSAILFLIATVTWPLVSIVLGDLAPKQS
jgi:hypothetical protein